MYLNTGRVEDPYAAPCSRKVNLISGHIRVSREGYRECPGMWV